MEESTTPAVTTRSAGTRYVIMAALSIVVFLAMSFASIDMSSGVGRWATLPIYLIVIYLAQKHFLDNGDGFMSYGQGMGITWWLALVSSVIYSIFFYVYIKFIDGSFVQIIMDKQREDMQNRGMSDEQIDQAMSFSAPFMSPEMMLVFGLIGGIIIIMICGLIVTIFTQKKGQEAI
jgi:hypothetical protein